MSTPRQLNQYYDSYWKEGSEVYSGERQGYADNFRRWMKAQFAGLDRPRVLEVGCGDAAFTRDLAGLASEVTALDISATQIARNAQRFPAIRFQQHDVSEPLPFTPGDFDVIWCSEVLEHLFDPAFAVREMHRVLAPGGKLLITVPHHGGLKSVLIALWKWEEHFAPTGPHIRFFTKKSLGKMVRSAGFRDVELTTCGIGQPVRDALIATNILLSARK